MMIEDSQPQPPVRYFRILLHGQNFLVDVEGEEQKLGFYVTRFLKAFEPDDAAGGAFALLREDPILSDAVLNGPNDEPFVDVEEMEELQDFSGIKELLPPLEWYPMKQESRDPTQGFTRLS